VTGSLISRGAWLGAPLLAAMLVTTTHADAQFCPSYTASSPNNGNGCAIEAVDGTNPTPAEWTDIFDLVSQGPAEWGDAGPTVDPIVEGCGLPTVPTEVPPRFPCEVLKAIAMVESGWRQFCEPSTPSDQVGQPSQTIISFDCGYGIGQVTSGMHVGENPDFDRDRVASDPTYNLATGTRILASKWGYTECVGDNLPVVVEHWYTATWAYNGLAYVNNPSNPNYDANRGVYDPTVGGGAPYQEKVFGRVEHPTDGLWDSVALAYPNPGDVGSSGSPPQLAEPECASPTDCVQTRATHVTGCAPGEGGAGGGGASGTGGSVGTGGDSSLGGSGGSSAGGGEGGETITGGGADEDDGCGCRTVGGGEGGHGPSPRWPLWGLALALALGAMRRRRS